MAVSWVSVDGDARTLGGDPVVPKPVGLAVDDLMLMEGLVSAAQTFTTPAGWATHPDSNGASRPLLYKFADSGDVAAASFTFVVSGAANASAVVSAYRGVNKSNPWAGTAGFVSTTSTTITIGAANPSISCFLAHIVSKLTSATFTPPGSASPEDWDQTFGTGTTACTGGGHETVAAGSTGTRVWTASAGAAVGMGYIVPLRQATQPIELLAVMDGNPFLTRRSLPKRALTGVMDGNPFLTKKGGWHLSAVLNGTPTVLRDLTLHRVLTAVMDGTPTLVRKVGKILTGVMDGTPTLVRKVTKTLLAVMDGNPTVQPHTTAHRTLLAVMDGNAFITQRFTLARRLTAVLNGITPTIGTHNVLGRVLAAIMSGIPTGFAGFRWDQIPESCPPDWSPNDGLKSIAGDVFFHEPPNEGDPVPGATVTLIRDSDGTRITTTTTDASGHYDFPRDTDDPYTYHVEVRYTNQQGLSEGGCPPT